MQSGSSSLKQRIATWFGEGFRPMPTAGWEWFLMRLAFAVLAFLDFYSPQPFQYESQPSPLGLARIFDLTWLNEPWAYPSFVTVAAIGLVSYVSGYGLVVSLPVLTLLHTLMRTYENSQGANHHSHHVITLVLLAQTLTLLVGRTRREWTPDRERSWLLYYTQGVVAATYVVAAVSKAINSKLMWVWNSPYVAFDFVKAQRQQYYRMLDPEFAGETVAAEWVLAHPMLSRIGFGGAFFLELFALIALKSRGWALWVGLGLIALHHGIYWVMHLRFFNSEWVALIFFVNLPYWFWHYSRRRIPACQTV